MSQSLNTHEVEKKAKAALAAAGGGLYDADEHAGSGNYATEAITFDDHRDDAAATATAPPDAGDQDSPDANGEQEPEASYTMAAATTPSAAGNGNAVGDVEQASYTMAAATTPSAAGNGNAVGDVEQASYTMAAATTPSAAGNGNAVGDVEQASYTMAAATEVDQEMAQPPARAGVGADYRLVTATEVI